MNGNYEALCRYFNALDREGRQIPYYTPSDVGSIGPGIEQLVTNGVIDRSKPFLDAGSGDGRVVALTAGVHGIVSVGVDLNDEFCNKAERNIQSLIKIGVLNGTLPKIIHGDFTLDETYESEGIRFEYFGTIYNFKTNEGLIAEKIARQSPRETVFLLHVWYNEPGGFEGLVLKERVLLSPTQGLYVYRKNPKKFYMHLFKSTRWFL